MRGYMVDILPRDKLPKKCKFCGSSLEALGYPKYSLASGVNHICTGGQRGRRCNVHYYGDYPDMPRWYTGKEWEEMVNAEVS